MKAGWRWLFATQFRKLCAVTTLIILVVITWFWSDLCLWRAEVALMRRRHDAAAIWLRLAQFSNSHPDQLCLLKLRLARRQGDFKQVEQQLHMAQRLGVPLKELRREQLLAMAQTQQFDDVAAHWPELLVDPREDEPEIARAYVVWASSMHLIGEAIQMVTVWEKDYPLDPEPFALHGQLARAVNHDQGAVDSYRKASQLAPHNNEYRIALATALQNQLQFDEAIGLFEQALKLDPNNREALNGLAAAYSSRGDLSKALQLLVNATSRFPDDFDLHRTLGEVYLAQGDDASALQHLELYHQAHPENADVAYGVAKALKALHRDAEANPLFEFVTQSREQLAQLKPLEEKLSKHPQDLETRFQIASIVARYKSRDEAIRWLEKLLLIAPAHQPAQELLDRISKRGLAPKRQPNLQQ